MEHKWFAVRCCCQPRKVFGFIKLPADLASVRVMDRSGDTHRLEVKRMSECTVSGEIQREMAVYSEDRPIEFWRTLPGFVEAADNDGKPLDANTPMGY